jgi:hypothetical protein
MFDCCAETQEIGFYQLWLCGCLGTGCSVGSLQINYGFEKCAVA